MTEFSGKIWSMILMGLNKVFDPALCRSQYQAYSLELMLIFYFMTPLGGYSNIFETET